jgi:hypothetical protein
MTKIRPLRSTMPHSESGPGLGPGATPKSDHSYIKHVGVFLFVLPRENLTQLIDMLR